jgi:hypothetical protein
MKGWRSRYVELVWGEEMREEMLKTEVVEKDGGIVVLKFV